MAHEGAPTGAQPAGKAGKEGMTRRGFLEALKKMSPLYMFGAMLFGVFDKKGVSGLISEASQTLDFFGASVSGGGGKAGGGGGGEKHPPG